MPVLLDIGLKSYYYDPKRQHFSRTSLLYLSFEI